MIIVLTVVSMHAFATNTDFFDRAAEDRWTILVVPDELVALKKSTTIYKK